MPRIILTLICCLLANFTLISCTSDNAPKANELVVGIAAMPSTLDPRFATDANGMRLGSLVFSSLVKIGPNLDLIGDAAKSWDYKDKTFTFTLNSPLVFSNGKPLTKEDILFSFKAFQSPECPFSGAFEIIKSIDVKAEADGTPSHITISVKEYNAKFLSSDLPVVKFLPQQVVEQHGKDFAKHLVGTGPLVLKNKNEQALVFEQNVHHKIAPAKMEKVVFKVIKDDFTRFQKLKKGELDLVQGDLPASKVKEFEKDSENFNVYKYPGLSMTYLLVNLKDPNLKNLGLRQAIANAINRKEIIKYKLEGLAKEATSILTPNNPFHNAGLQNYEFNFDKALDAIESMGYKDLPLIIKTSNSRAAVENAKILVNQLNKAGLKAELQSFEWGTFYGDIKSGNFQLATMRWVGAMDPDVYRIAFHSKELPPSGRNRGAYTNPEIDELLEQGPSLEIENDRKEIYNKVQSQIHKDLPMIPLWYDEQVAVAHKRVKNYSPSENSDFSPVLNVSK